MGIISLILVIVLIGVLMWAVNAYVPMAPNIKKLLNIVVVVLLILWILWLIGVLPAGDIRVPRVR